MKKYFNYSDYKQWVNDWIALQPKSGRGELQNIARHLKIHGSMVTQILRGIQHFNFDQAYLMTEHMGISGRPQEFFILLVQHERAATPNSKNFVKTKIEEHRAEANRVENRIVKAEKIKESDQAIFYSDWYFNVIPLLSGIKGFDHRDAIAARLGLSRSTTHEVIDFLIRVGVMKEENGKLEVGTQRVHLKANSPMVARHHTNWRMRAMLHFPQLNDEELAFSSAVTLSKQDFKRVKAILLDVISSVSKTVGPSSAEELACLNIDWFKI